MNKLILYGINTLILISYITFAFGLFFTIVALADYFIENRTRLHLITSFVVVGTLFLSPAALVFFVVNYFKSKFVSTDILVRYKNTINGFFLSALILTIGMWFILFQNNAVSLVFDEELISGTKQDSKNDVAIEEKYSHSKEKVFEDTRKFYPYISAECVELEFLSDGSWNYVMNKLRCDHERSTGQTFEISSTTIRVVEWDVAKLLSGTFSTTSYEAYENVVVSKELHSLTQIPYLTLLATTSNSLILTSHCFVAKACGHAGLYRYNMDNRTLTLMKNQYFDVAFMTSKLSPDKTKVVSSDENYNFDSPNNLYYMDLITDSLTVLDTIDPTKGEGTFCTRGMGGCGDIEIEWLDANTIDVKVFENGSQETRRYTLD